MGLEWWVYWGQVTQGLVGYCEKLQFSTQALGSLRAEKERTDLCFMKIPPAMTGGGMGDLLRKPGEDGWVSGWTQVERGAVGKGWKGQKYLGTRKVSWVSDVPLPRGTDTYENPSWGTFI